MKALYIFLLLLLTTGIFAQSPERFNYQALALDQDDKALILSDIQVLLTIKDGQNGTALFQEEHRVRTNEAGIFSLVIGDGQTTFGNLNTVRWDRSQPWIGTQVDFGNNQYIDLGDRQLLSVPFAMHALTASDVNDADADPMNEIQSLSLNGQTLALSNGGGSVVLPTSGGSGHLITDNDGDTKVDVESQQDEDVIRFTVDGQERMTLIQNQNGTPRLEIGGFFKNTFVGKDAGLNNFASLFDGGGNNVAIGANAAQELINGNANTFVGQGAGEQVTTGSSNVGIGQWALRNNETESELTAVGTQACEECTGYRNTALGYRALRSNKGFQNIGLGHEAMSGLINGDNNVSIGVYSMTNSNEGSDNVAMGNLTLQMNEGDGNTAVGTSALLQNRSSNNNTAIGHESMQANTFGIHNVAVGANTMKTGERNNFSVAVGFGAMAEAVESDEIVAIGLTALYENGKGATEDNHGQRNTAVGAQALNANTIGYDNTSLGHHALRNNVSGWSNVAIGRAALENMVEGWANTAVGFQALQNNTSGTNTAVGNSSMRDNTTGFRNTALGHWTLTFNSTGDYNVALGSEALFSNESGSFNTAVGYASNNVATGFSNTTSLGYAANCTADNQVRIGNSSVTSIGGYVDWTKVSDGRFKSDVKEDIPGLDFIDALRPVSYRLDQQKISTWRSKNIAGFDPEGMKDDAVNTDVQTGFIAQEVEVAAKSLGYEFSGVDAPQNENDHYGIRYAEFVMPLVKAVQELNDIIEAQNQKIENLESRIKELE